MDSQQKGANQQNPETKWTDSQTAIYHVIQALLKQSGDNSSHWIPYAVGTVHSESMGFGGLGELLAHCIHIDMDEAEVKRFITKKLKLKRGTSNKGIFYYSEFDEKGNLKPKPTVIYKVRDERGGAPYENVMFRDPDDEGDMIVIKESLVKISEEIMKQESGVTLNSCAKLRSIKAKGQVVGKPQKRRSTAPVTKKDPSKRMRPTINQHQCPEACRMKAAGDAVLSDKHGAQSLVDLSDCLDERFEVNKWNSIKNKDLTPKRRAARDFYRSGQLIRADQHIVERAQNRGTAVVVTPEKPAESDREPLSEITR